MIYQVIMFFEDLCSKARISYNKLKLKSSGVTVGKNVKIVGKLKLILKGNPKNIVIGDNFLCLGDIELYVREKGGINIAHNVQMDGNIHLTAANNATISIGEGTRICNHCTINAGDDVSIGKYCLIPDYCHINASDHNIKIGIPFLEQGYSHSPITIGDNVLFGAFTCVKRGAEIGDGVVIGYQSVVTGRIEKNSIAAGAPAKVIKTRS